MKEVFGFFLFSSLLSVRGATPCDWGTYGEHCNLTCPLNCLTNVDRQLRHCHQQTGKCSEGCVAGWYGDRCGTRCSKNCLKDVCIRLNGQCFKGCKDNHTNTGDFCNVTKEIGPSDSDSDDEDSVLVSILVPLAVLIILVAAAVAVYFFRRHRRNRQRTHFNESCQEEIALIDSPFKKCETGEVPHLDTVDQASRGGSGNTGVMGKDALDREIAKTKEVFLMTSIYETVKDKLEKCGHVTMSGAAGGGKRSIAVMLGAYYQELGFQLVYVVDVCRFKLSEYIGHGKDVCFIFHDILRTLDFSQDVSQLRDMLRDLRQCQSEDMDERETGERRRNKVYAILTTNMHNVKTGISQLEEQENIFFKGPSFLDLTDMSYTFEEKKEIFLHHCKNRQIALDVDKICQFEQTFLGFPQTCKLFFEFQNFQKYSERFFQAPFRYLREELLTILQGLNDKAAALIVMFLSDDDLNIHQVESQSDNHVLEAIFTSLEDVVHISSRTAVAMAIRQFRGTFFTKGDITGFSHRTVYNACACALFDINPSFVLKHCRAQFLDEYVQGGQGVTTVVNKYEPRVYLSDLYTGPLEERLAELGVKESIKGNMESKGGCNTGTISQDLLDNEIAETKKSFVKTSIYEKVKDMLEKCGHVTMSGAAGGGKRSIAVMLGAHYQELGFQLVYVVDVCRFKLSEHIGLGKDVCFIFHDILRTLDLKDVSHLRDLLQELNQYFVKFSSRSEMKSSKRSSGRKKHRVYAIFTTNTHDAKSGIPQLGELETFFFKGDSSFDLTSMSSCQYTTEEKKEIFMNHCKHDQTSFDVDTICKFDQPSLGFPQTCKLFVEYLNFQRHCEDFFRDPFHYLREELVSILRCMNEQSAALVLMFLCSKKLNLRELERSENSILEDLLKTAKGVVPIKTRTSVVMAVRKFRGTFFTKGDMTGFSHQTVYNACASALFDINPSFTLEHCHLQFLRDHVHVQSGDTTTVDKYKPLILLSEVYGEIYTKRLAGTPIRHPSVKE